MRRLPLSILALLPALWAGGAFGAEEEPAWMARTPEIRFQARPAYNETTLQQSVFGMFGYSLALKATPDGRSELSAGPLVRPLKGLEIGFDRGSDYWGKLDESLVPEARYRIGAPYDPLGAPARSQPVPVYLGTTGPLRYELNGSRLRVKYYIDEQTALSVRTSYNRAEQRMKAWLWLERRF